MSDLSNFREAAVAVVGAGAAGLLAACRAAEFGAPTVLIEKNKQPGVKILMSGGTRCNLTQATDRRGIIDAFGEQGPFLHSPLAALPPEDLIQLFHDEGVHTKIEATGKVFPSSDRAVDVRDALVKRLARSGAKMLLNSPVRHLAAAAHGWTLDTSVGSVRASQLIVTTGGQSYPGCGTTGDGYDWLAALGHQIVRPRPALTPLTIRADWAKSLRGVTMTDVSIRLVDSRDQRSLAERRGSLLFAHFGLSGPVILDLSRFVTLHERPRALTLECDFLPELTREELGEQLQQWSREAGKRQLGRLLADNLPRRLAEAILQHLEIPADRRAAELSRTERTKLVDACKSTVIPVTGSLGFEKAEVTTGGVALSEVESSTMKSKRVDRLFLAGEILDLDGPIGGYNFQAAFSTGWLAGESAALAHHESTPVTG